MYWTMPQIKKLTPVEQAMLKIIRQLRFVEKLWWRWMPGVTIKVKWPVGNVIVLPTDDGWDWTLGTTPQEIFSADPNDHYRPWMEANVGQQGWDWNWRLTDNDVAENILTIKFRRGREQWASVAALRWT